MLSKLIYFVCASVLLFGINHVFAQNIEHDKVAKVTSVPIYEFSGVSRYISYPTKFLFGNQETLDSLILEGYHADPSSIDCENDLIVFERKYPEPWWRKPQYKLIGINSSVTKNNDSDDIVVIPYPNSMANNDSVCSTSTVESESTGIEPKLFVVNNSILNLVNDKDDSSEHSDIIEHYPEGDNHHREGE